MASPWGSPSSSLWVTLGQASNVAQLVGVDALGLISMVVQAALAARRHRDACMQLAQHHEIDMFIRLIPLIALVDNSTNTHRVQEAAEQVDGIFIEGSNHRVRFAARVLDITEIRVQGARKLCNVREHPSLGIVGTQEQKTLDNKELVKLCMLTLENYPGFTEFSYFQIMDATDKFSEKRYLGSGGFATAYKVFVNQ
uniref:Uncharacterized protein n=1 Tax=Triticum urartu TaxID=4572 RepID=A0A8R7R3I5_TRIUA